MSGAGIEAPYTITSLPRPLDRKHGRIQASSVFGLGGSRKRKRHEVAVGIDGEGVTIYNVMLEKRCGRAVFVDPLNRSRAKTR